MKPLRTLCIVRRGDLCYPSDVTVMFDDELITKTGSEVVTVVTLSQDIYGYSGKKLQNECSTIKGIGNSLGSNDNENDIKAQNVSPTGEVAYNQLSRELPAPVIPHVDIYVYTFVNNFVNILIDDSVDKCKNRLKNKRKKKNKKLKRKLNTTTVNKDNEIFIDKIDKNISLNGDNESIKSSDTFSDVTSIFGDWDTMSVDTVGPEEKDNGPLNYHLNFTETVILKKKGLYSTYKDINNKFEIVKKSLTKESVECTDVYDSSCVKTLRYDKKLFVNNPEKLYMPWIENGYKSSFQQYANQKGKMFYYKYNARLFIKNRNKKPMTTYKLSYMPIVDKTFKTTKAKFTINFGKSKETCPYCKNSNSIFSACTGVPWSCEECFNAKFKVYKTHVNTISRCKHHGRREFTNSSQKICDESDLKVRCYEYVPEKMKKELLHRKALYEKITSSCLQEFDIKFYKRFIDMFCVACPDHHISYCIKKHIITNLNTCLDHNVIIDLMDKINSGTVLQKEFIFTRRWYCYDQLTGNIILNPDDTRLIKIVPIRLPNNTKSKIKRK